MELNKKNNCNISDECVFLSAIAVAYNTYHCFDFQPITIDNLVIVNSSCTCKFAQARTPLDSPLDTGQNQGPTIYVNLLILGFCISHGSVISVVHFAVRVLEHSVIRSTEAPSSFNF